MSAVVLGD
jgi:hypothetical protein